VRKWHIFVSSVEGSTEIADALSSGKDAAGFVARPKNILNSFRILFT